MTLGAVIYFLLLALWSGVVAYLVLFKVLYPSAPHHSTKTHTKSHPPTPTQKPQPRRTFSTYDGFRSFAKGDELTVEDIVKALSGR